MYYSLESINITGHYIRHRNFLGEISPVGSDLDRSDATFQLGEDPSIDDVVFFRSVNFPLHVLRHQFFEIKLHEYNPPLGGPTPEQEQIRADATFFVRRGNADASAFSFESSNLRGHFLRHRNFKLFIDRVGDDLARRDSTFRRKDPFAPPPPVIVH